MLLWPLNANIRHAGVAFHSVYIIKQGEISRHTASSHVLNILLFKSTSGQRTFNIIVEQFILVLKIYG